MRKRDKGFIVRLSNEEMMDLNRKVKDKGIPREVYVRSILTGYVPIGKPSIEYLDTIRELRRVGNNLNQIARVANSNNTINCELYEKEVIKLKDSILRIQEISNTANLMDQVNLDRIISSR